VQVSEELNSLKGSKNFSIVPIYGGQSWGMQTKHLRSGVDVVVGTPGRIMEHLQKGTLKLDTIEYFVLDEADEMLNMGFIEDIEKILSYAPAKKKVLLFSATMPSRIANLAKKYMTNPEIIKTEKDRITNNSVDQIYF
jgi:ATP-dependent RNA helicase DeaD